MDFDLKISLQLHRSRVQCLMCRSTTGRQGEILSNRTFELDFIQCCMMQNKLRVSSFAKFRYVFFLDRTKHCFYSHKVEFLHPKL